MIRLGATDAELGQAMAALDEGRVVAFPTDTAYGLGARPELQEAVDAVYRIKGRPAHMPLILLAATTEALLPYLAAWPEVPKGLAERWWPGALTLVLPASDLLPPWLSNPRGTIGIRVPDHPVARALLAASGPLATTSANLSGSASPRDAGAVENDLGTTELAVLLDGGATRHGHDSTVLDLSCDPLVVLREGAVTREALGL